MPVTANASADAIALAAVNEQEAKNREIEIRLNAEKDNIARELNEAKRESMELFETDDLAKLRELYQSYSQADREAIAGYSDVVSKRAQVLNDIQKRLNEYRSAQTGMKA